MKTVRLGSQDKGWINGELKRIHRLKSREYAKRGKSVKYNLLKKEFDDKYVIEAKKYLEKNVENLKETNPGRAYSTLKKMGSQPGDCTDSNTFDLPNHLSENLNPQESAERIADHFSDISKTFPPLSFLSLPSRVQTKPNSDKTAPPIVSVEDTYMKIERSKKPRSGVQCDLPKQITKEFSVELPPPSRE